MKTMKQSGLWSSLGNYGSLVVIWWLCISSSGEARKFDFLSQIWPWRSWSIATQITRDLNQCILHLWSKFGDPSLNEWWVMVRTSSKWGKFRFDLKFYLEGQGWLPPKTIGTLTKVFCIFGPSLVILAWTGDELSRGQTWWRTEGRTDGRGNDNTRRPKASGKSDSNASDTHWGNLVCQFRYNTVTFVKCSIICWGPLY